MRQPIYNLESVKKTAIFLDLRTLELKNPLFSILLPREPQTTIPENKKRLTNKFLYGIIHSIFDTKGE